MIADGGTGAVTATLRQRLVDIQRGRATDPYGWVHRVL
jgi:branched-chain amino acid aminotransferase